MPVLLVRHAQALPRSDWDGRDRDRSLSTVGRRQSRKLVRMLTDYKPSRVLSSPYVRCLDTVAPLADALGVQVEPEDALAEGSTSAALWLVRELAGEDVVLCSHGDVIPLVLAELDAEFRLGIGPDPRNAKASVWVCDAHGGRYTKATYLKAPRG
jgi:broad specificity phosphatase PhoE